MTKALRVNVNDTMIELARTLDSGHKNFRELKWEHQVMLAESGLSLEGLATESELRDYEVERRLREAERPLETVRAKVMKEVHDARNRLGIR